MYNMFSNGSPNNNVIDPRMESMQPDPNQVNVAPMNPVVEDDKKMKRQQAMLAALKAMGSNQVASADGSNPYSAAIEGIGKGISGVAGMYSGGK